MVLLARILGRGRKVHTDQVWDKEEYILFRVFLLNLCGPHCGAIAVGLLLY